MAASNAASVTPAAAVAAPRLSLLLVGRRRNAPARAAAGGGGGAGGASYLDMWRKAVERERRSAELARRLQAPAPAEAAAPPVDVVERRTARFEDLLRVPREERDRVQRRQVIDRAAAALAAARAVLKEPPPAPAPAPAQSPPPSPPTTPPQGAETAKVESGGGSTAIESGRGSRSAAPAPASQSAEGTGFHWVHVRLFKDHSFLLINHNSDHFSF
jgi:hypothetical protein